MGHPPSEVQDLKDSEGVQEARDYYKRCGGGRPVHGGHPFGLKGLRDSGLNPTLQYVGSYDWTISPNPDGTVSYTITNNTSANSFFYKLSPSWPRGPSGSDWHIPFGTTDQTYHWREPAAPTSGRKDPTCPQ